MKTLVWRRLDEPGMEAVHVESLSRATGVQIGRDYELRWRLEDEHIELDLNSERHASVELDGADFFDVFASPFFNSLPAVRDGLLEAGQPRDYVMQFINVPELTVVRSNQHYEPRGGRVVRYSSGAFIADIAFDGGGFVTLYEGFLERIS
jgi:uncharacterized protein